MDEIPAFELAAHWHKGQVRKGLNAEPFVSHPLRVARLLIQFGVYDQDILDAALLHDILEDTDCPEILIQQQLSRKVLRIVKELTDDKTLLKSARKQHQVERASLLSPEATLIRLADKIDNVGSLLNDPPETWSWQRQRDYVAWANRVVKNLNAPPAELLQSYQQVQAQVWERVTGQIPL
ncbi:HD domain-containing protein [Kiritimatiellota bacterium B12222]|nr:HD domain-containing protein [Kiritimatiellota bacterium B12222]